MPTWSERLAAVSALAEPIRRSLFELVSRSSTPVTRDSAAEQLGLPRSTAAFHLDRLAEQGLLDVGFQRLTGRTGPGSGRPAKIYRPAAAEVGVSVPDRRYDLAGELLATAVERSSESGEPVREVLLALARDEGRALGAAADSIDDVLDECGFEPHEDGAGGLVLANCPFHRLAERHPDIVCGLNEQFLQGVADAVQEPRSVVLDPGLGRCCVSIRAQQR